jgi:peptidoglycan L-alanyl-D-glutamate endopeptidase CwlK
MPKFSQKSMDKLNTADHHLVILFQEVIKYRDCSVVWGHRGQADQDAAFASGASKLKWPNGEHNKKPSRAVDVAPWINGKASGDSAECYTFAGFVLGLAAALGLDGRIRWGGDWDQDDQVRDQTFNDLWHFEIV